MSMTTPSLHEQIKFVLKNFLFHYQCTESIHYLFLSRHNYCSSSSESAGKNRVDPRKSEFISGVAGAGRLQARGGACD